MHLVIKHLLARKNRSVPVHDDRKIVLVVFGGAMTGVCGAGALAGLGDMGFGQAFDEIWSYSAGFANAASFLSQKIPFGYQIYYDDLTNKKFINLWRFWRIVDIGYLIFLLKTKEYVKPKIVLEQSTKLFVFLRNLSLGKYELLRFMMLARVISGILQKLQCRYHISLQDLP